jgi:ribosomal protein S18 acetylase RimI-like enzyme
MQMEFATTDDAAEILALQRAAYQQVAERYGDYTIPPLTESLEDTEDQLALQTVLKVDLAGRIVGSVRAYQNGSTCFVGRLIVDPAYQGQGIGTALMLSVESHFPEAECFELFTGHKCEDTLRLYRRLGYVEVGREPISTQLTHVVLHKEMNPGDRG